MPLPLIAETAGDWALKVGELIDREVDAHITDGDPLPSLPTLLAMLTPIVRVALREALLEVADDAAQVAAELIEARTAEIVASMEAAIARSLRDARRLRRQVVRVTPDDIVDAGGVPVPLARMSVAKAIAARIVSRRLKTPDRATMRADARRAVGRVGAKIPAKTAGQLQMDLRTAVAVARNVFGADIADRSGRVMWVRDGRLGPTDKDCERVDRKYATTSWVRRHPTAHPNCTRMAIPVDLPAGERVTLV